MSFSWRSLCWLVLALGLMQQAGARTFYVDARSGTDTHNGQSETTAWKSLDRVHAETFQPGDQLLLKRGSRFAGGLKLKWEGTESAPIELGAYGEGESPLIDAAGYLAGVHLYDSQYVVVRDLTITADGGETVDGSSPRERYGVFIEAKDGSCSNISVKDLTIYKIYPEKGSEHEGHQPTTHLGTAIEIRGSAETESSGFLIEGCRIAQVGFKAISLHRVKQIEVLDNRMKEIGGPAIQPGRSSDIVVRGNVVDGSGSNLDPRMHARGSGIWPWGCERVLIEKNIFKHARGKADSCGVHIDYNCRDVIVQYNLTIDNEGGFIEILGNNHNCAYRYNISINDGFRVKGDNGAHQEGKVLWTSGYVGSKREKTGPFNSYIYNNTIYVKSDIRTCFSIASSTDGLLIANNIFHILSRTESVMDDQDNRKDRRETSIPNARMSNNLFYRESVLPEGLPVRNENRLLGDPRFRKPGGMEAQDYIPTNNALIQDRGIEIPLIAGDEKGLTGGLKMEQDFFGNPITGLPDIGAIEIQ